MRSAYNTAEFGLSGSLLAEYLLESLGAGVAVQDANGVVAWNSSAPALLGLSESELEGLDPLPTDWSMVYPNGQRMARRDRPAARVLHDGIPIRDVILGIRSPGRPIVWLNVTAMPIHGPGGEVRAVLSTFADVSDVKNATGDLERAEARFRQWFEDGLSANLVVAPNGQIVAWNRMATDFLGRNDAEMFDLDVSDLLVLDLDATVDLLPSDGGSSSVEGSTHVLVPDGTEVEVDAHVVRIEWPGHHDCVMIQMVRPSGHSEPVERWHASAFADSLVSMLLIDPDGQVAAANRSSGSMMAERSVDLVGRPLASLLSIGERSIEQVCREVRDDQKILEIDGATLHTASGVQPVYVRFSVADDDATQVLVQLMSAARMRERVAS